MPFPSLLAILATLGAVVAAGVAIADTPSASTTTPFGTLTFTPCTLATPGEAFTVAARCANLRVPEDRARPDTRRIELAVAWIPSTAKHPQPDPVLFLAGGPGQSALESYPLVAEAFRETLRSRHVVLVDQRGTGRSHRLDCPETAGAIEDLQEADAAVMRELTVKCLAELRNDADPRLYTTGDYVSDLEEVRRALGVAAVNLVGVSYGTRVGLEYLRRHPAAVRSVVLDSVVPARLILGAEHARNLDEAVNAQFARCEADHACREKFGSPRQRLDALLARLRAQPVTVAYHDPVTDEPREDTLTADTVAGVVRLHAYAPQLFAMVPMLLEGAANGRYDTLMAHARMIERLVGEQIGIALQLSVTCAEDAPWLVARPEDRDTLMGTTFVDAMHAQCEVWPRGTVPKDFHDPVRANRAVLLLSGEFDPVTPPRYGAEVHRDLPNSRHLVLRGQGHSVLGIACTPRLMAQFFRHADAKALDARCLDALAPPPPFMGAFGWDP